jgi:NAD-dependent deacetylase
MSSITRDIVESIQLASDLIKNSHHSVVLTGAGISTPSGIPDFRTPGTGLWTKYLPMEVASLSAFRYNPELFYQWLHPLVQHMRSARPNPAHYSLAKLEENGFIESIITQNIDGLHSRAGSKNVIEVHGTLNSLTCIKCFIQVSSELIIQEYIDNCLIPHCQICGGILKPDVILYEEQLPIKTWIKAEEACRKCDLLIVAGTSLEVMPSAKLPVLALDNGASLIIINITNTYIDIRADIIIRADVADIFPQISEKVLNV